MTRAAALGGGLVLALAAAGGAYWYVSSRPEGVRPVELPPPPPPVAEADPEVVRQFCGTGCHGLPPPESFPRWAWRKEVEQGYYFAGKAHPPVRGPDLDAVLAFYEARAPAELPPPSRPAAAGPAPVSWARRGVPGPTGDRFPQVSNVNVVQLTPGGPAEVLVCECDPLTNEGRVLVCNPAADPPAWRELAKAPVPVHAEAADLDADGKPDVLVACLGRFFPSDDKTGSVIWLRNKGDGTFEPVTLLRDVGRVADVQAADFDGDGKLDLAVAEFGWRDVGSVLVLDNRTADWSKPRFEPRTIDRRHGAIHVPVADLNGDGRPDVVALLSQEHEAVVAFLNDGKGGFRPEVVYAAPHPAYGSSGIQLVDLDGNGKLDVLYTNGDVLDKPFLVKPYHGVHWLENRGAFPFPAHRLADMPGVARAVAVDVRGTGRPDVFAVSYLPVDDFPARETQDLDAVLWLEQTAPGKFVRRPLETRTCDHFTCVAGDVTGSGRPSLVVGNFWSSRQRPITDAFGIWSPAR